MPVGPGGSPEGLHETAARANRRTVQRYASMSGRIESNAK